MHVSYCFTNCLVVDSSKCNGHSRNSTIKMLLEIWNQTILYNVCDLGNTKTKQLANSGIRAHNFTQISLLCRATGNSEEKI